MMRKGVGAKLIREKMQAYVNALKTEFSNGLILVRISFQLPYFPLNSISVNSISVNSISVNSISVNLI